MAARVQCNDPNFHERLYCLAPSPFFSYKDVMIILQRDFRVHGKGLNLFPIVPVRSFPDHLPVRLRWFTLPPCLLRAESSLPLSVMLPSTKSVCPFHPADSVLSDSRERSRRLLRKSFSCMWFYPPLCPPQNVLPRFPPIRDILFFTTRATGLSPGPAWYTFSCPSTDVLWSPVRFAPSPGTGRRHFDPSASDGVFLSGRRSIFSQGLFPPRISLILSEKYCGPLFPHFFLSAWPSNPFL